MKTKLQEYALIAEIAGALGIIASLVFVGVQVNQNAEETSLNTRQIQAAAFSELTNSLNQINILLIENPEMLDAWLKVENDQELSPREYQLYVSFVRMFAQLSELAWQQYEMGIISEESLMQAIGPLLNNIYRSEIFREIYVTSTMKSQRFVDYISTISQAEIIENLQRSDEQARAIMDATVSKP